ncbi:nitrilase-related carbon-nitrogen hydrolase [uncultured Draconibacterium sp.]|uniref:nitrilase-related carbon-nitrogen hydrolase n=1 Tax=uncultured Draconibacterium sp. TaxID=1573823 RepID=UPI002AA89C99|nr:nitrilase-related carbon-nitrogen hydrolase [uncultured Draconibacterium sp.]
MQTKQLIIKSFTLLIGMITLTLTGINWSMWWAAWLAPVFLLFYFRRAKKFDFVIFFLLLFVSGMLSQTGNNLFHLPVVNVINGIIFCILYSISYLIDRLLYGRHKPFYYTLIFPSVAVLVEYFASFAIGTWGSIAHTQFAIKPLLLLSAICGIFGVSFLVFWLAPVVNLIIENYDNRKQWIKGALIYAIVLCTVMGYGTVRMYMNKPEPDNGIVKVAAILSDIDIHEVVLSEQQSLKQLADGIDSEIPESLLSDSVAIKIMIERTRQAVNEGAKILVWNEAALVLDHNQKKQLLDKEKQFCTDKGVYLLVSFLETNSNSGDKPFNNVNMLITPEGEIIWKYKKSFLHPYAEAPIVNRGDARIPFIDTEYGRLGTVICSDLDMPHFLKQAGCEDINILLVPAFDWEGITPFHAEMAVFPGVEYGLSVVRANGKGLTTFTDYLGNSLVSTNSFVSDEKIVYAEIPLLFIRTIYTALGDLVIYLALAYLVFIFIGCRLRK